MAWGWGGGGEFFRYPFLGKNASNIQAKPLDFRPSNGENIWARDFRPHPPPPNETRPVRL